MAAKKNSVGKSNKKSPVKTPQKGSRNEKPASKLASSLKNLLMGGSKKAAAKADTRAKTAAPKDQAKKSAAKAPLKTQAKELDKKNPAHAASKKDLEKKTQQAKASEKKAEKKTAANTNQAATGKAAPAPAAAPKLTKAPRAPKGGGKGGRGQAKTVESIEKAKYAQNAKSFAEKMAKLPPIKNRIDHSKSTPEQVTKSLMAIGLETSARIAESSMDSMCREVGCESVASSAGYCRLHYIKNWKKIKKKEQFLMEGKLVTYLQELVNKYPDKYLDAIRNDLIGDADFAKVIRDLDLDESVDDFEGDGEGVEGLIDTGRRDFDDDVDTF